MLYQNLIENKLLEIEPGRFQLLCNEILTKLNYGNITNSGGQVGTDKTIKGTPDAYILNESGKFTFIEYSVSQSGLVKKFIKDIKNCLNYEKTDVEVKNIEKIILMFNSVLTVGEINELNSLCIDHSVKFEKFDISNIASLLHDKFPYLVEEYFQIGMSSGQFLDKDAFICANKKGVLSTPLDIDFIGREEEVEEIILRLETSSFLIISGKSGVGKTKLAVEAIDEVVSKSTGYQKWFVRDLGAGIYKDLIKYTQYGNHILLIDDINKLTAIDSILEYVSENKERIKVVSTVRDYALSTTLTRANRYTKSEVIEVEKLSDEEIEEICKSYFGIYNPDYLLRIKKLSKGNPRIAVMMATVAKKNQSLNSISNVSELLEVYYADISRQLIEIDDEKVIKVLGILSFYDKLHLKDTDTLNEISELIGMESADINEYIWKLFRMELVDIYEDEVARVSDQILSVFVFHYVYEIRQTLDYKEIFKLYFPKYKNRLIQNINSVTTYYGNINFFTECIDNVWSEWEKNNNENLHELILTCWFVRKAKTLVYIQDFINCIEYDENIQDDFHIEKNFRPEVPSEIETLCYYKNTEYYSLAFDLILKYLEKAPQKIKDISSVIISNFGYSKFSHLEKYEVQFYVLDKMVSLLTTENVIWDQLFTNLAAHYLSYDFEYTESLDGKSFVFSQVGLLLDGKMAAIRSTIWFQISEWIRRKGKRKYAVKILKDLRFGRFVGQESDLYSFDFREFNEKVVKVINPSSFDDCLLLDHVEKNVFSYLGFDLGLESISKSNDFLHYSVLSKDKHFVADDYEESLKMKKEMLQDHINGYGYDDFKDLFKSCAVIERLGIKLYDIRDSIRSIADLIEVEDLEVFIKAYLEVGTPLKIEPTSLIHRYILANGKTNCLKMINSMEFDDKEYWEFCYYSILSDDEITKSDYESFVNFFERNTVATSRYYRNLEFLEKFKKFDPDVFPNICRMINSSCEQNTKELYYQMFFKRGDLKLEEIVENFSSDISILEDIYLFLIESKNLYDPKSEILSQLLLLNPELLIKVCRIVFSRSSSYSNFNGDFSFLALWRMEYEYVERVFNIVINEFSKYSIGSKFGALFNNRSDDVDVVEIQDRHLKKYILKNSSSLEIMKVVYDAISMFSVSRRIMFILYFVEINKSFDCFKRLPINKSVDSWSGSEVPYVENKIAFYKQIDEGIKSIDLLKHKVYIQDIIKSLEESIRSIRINEFIRDY